MSTLSWLTNQAKKVLAPPPRPARSYAADPSPPANRQQFEQRENFIGSIRADPEGKDVPIESLYSAYNGGQGLPQSYAPAPRAPGNTGASASSGGSRRRGGGRRGGGGGGAAAGAQSQLDFLLPFLATGFKAQPMTALRDSIGTATREDQATSTKGYDALDTWLKTNLTNPYQNLNLGSDAFGDAAGVLRSNADLMNNSSRAGAQMARASSTTGIGALDNAYLASVGQQELQAQQALDAEKRQGIMQILPLLAAGAKAPADWMAQLGLGPAAAPAAPGQQDFFNWFNSNTPEQQAQFRATYGGG